MTTIQDILNKHMPRIDLDPTKPMILAGCTIHHHNIMLKNIDHIQTLIISDNLDVHSPEFKKMFLDICFKSFNGKCSPKRIIDIVDALIEYFKYK